MIAGRILMIGCGAMGGAMLAGWLAGGLDPAQVLVVSPSGRALPPGITGVRAVPAGETFDIVVLALKPQQLGTLAATPLAGMAPRVLISVLAGVECATLARVSGAQAVVRAMPNLPVAIGRGVVAVHGGDAGAQDLVGALMRPLGPVEWIGDEGAFDLVTALAGSGPAFLYRFADALGAAATALGLPAEQAARLALATVDGAARLAADSGEAPAVLADRVASPGGSTRAGLDVLDRDGALVTLLTETLAAATRRNGEMAAAAR